MINIYKTTSNCMEREMLSNRRGINWGRTSWPWNALEKLTSWIWESIFSSFPEAISEAVWIPCAALKVLCIQSWRQFRTELNQTDLNKDFPKGIKMFVNVVSQPPWVNLNQKGPVAAGLFKPVILQVYALEEQYMTKMVCSHAAQGLSSCWGKLGRVC